jgi:hypothetical protein
MELFIEKTWFIWWAFAVVAILRWFHVSSANVRLDEETPQNASSREEAQVHNQLASGA